MNEDPEFDSVNELVKFHMDKLRGRLCGLIESWGLDERQERAAIQTLKSISYNSERIIKKAIDDIEQ